MAPEPIHPGAAFRAPEARFPWPDVNGTGRLW